jgi:hypothetical protein
MLGWATTREVYPASPLLTSFHPHPQTHPKTKKSQCFISLTLNDRVGIKLKALTASSSAKNTTTFIIDTPIIRTTTVEQSLMLTMIAERM